MKSEAYDGNAAEPRIADGSIRVTLEWLNAHVKDKGKGNENLLNDAIESQSICPRVFWFKDTPEVRAVLGL